VETLCPFCGVGCQTRVQVADEKIIAVEGRNGPANENRLCVKGRFGYDYISHPGRLTRPLVRREDAPKDAGMTLAEGDWSQVFREASWAEALERAAGGLKAVLERDGDDVGQPGCLLVDFAVAPERADGDGDDRGHQPDDHHHDQQLDEREAARLRRGRVPRPAHFAAAFRSLYVPVPDVGVVALATWLPVGAEGVEVVGAAPGARKQVLVVVSPGILGELLDVTSVLPVAD